MKAKEGPGRAIEETEGQENIYASVKYPAEG
jgi:hypothetical protein